MPRNYLKKLASNIWAQKTTLWSCTVMILSIQHLVCQRKQALLDRPQNQLKQLKVFPNPLPCGVSRSKMIVHHIVHNVKQPTTSFEDLPLVRSTRNKLMWIFFCLCGRMKLYILVTLIFQHCDFCICSKAFTCSQNHNDVATYTLNVF